MICCKMKTRFLFLVIVSTTIGTVLFSNSFASAFCVVNEDWPDAPCFDVFPINRYDYRKAWMPYYDYKGSEWMESKKTEMVDAKNNDKLAEWMNSDISNHNVFSYYLSVGEISFPPEYDGPFFEDDFRYYLQFNQVWLIIIIIGIILTSIIVVIFVIKKRK